jgi:hypothetical protein
MPQFPNEPRIGQVVAADPNEQQFLTQIRLSWEEDGHGEAQAIQRMPTSANKHLLRTVMVDKELNVGDEITVRIIDRLIKSYVFLEDMGWTPKALGDPEVRFERKGKLQYGPGLTLTTGRYIVYHEIFVNLLPTKEEEENERT